MKTKDEIIRHSEPFKQLGNTLKSIDRFNNPANQFIYEAAVKDLIDFFVNNDSSFLKTCMDTYAEQMNVGFGEWVINEWQHTHLSISELYQQYKTENGL